MPPTLKVEIVSVHEEIFSGFVEFVVLPGEAGELGILPGHTPLLTRLHAGAVRLKLPEPGADDKYFIAGGMAEIQPSHVTVLADVAIRAKDLDEAKALAAMRQAQNNLREAQADHDFARAQAEIEGLMTQLLNLRRPIKRNPL